ncbi:MAG TPA: pantoate--beta-alanine ligase [Desulfuromonas sp.]|nr:pantoate--beta-alanine ligase [Desulfuromonas sp.]
MDIISDPQQMQQRALAEKRAGRRVALVPTMGYLHAGHRSLLQEGRKRGDFLVLSLFVNPTQFGPSEDLSTYPRDLEADLALARAAGVDVVWTPTPQEVYPAGYATWVAVEGGLTTTLCGASRPGHFRGVTTVVSKLFNVVQPDVALFGEKDFQQLAVIRQMVRDLNFPIEIVGMPIVREADGLAMSSRNVYLTPDQRRQALVLSQALALARELAAAGERESATILATLRQLIAAQPDARIDYLHICHQTTLQEQARIDAAAVLLLAVFIGKTRLIDNGFLL